MKTFLLPLLAGFATGVLSAWGVGGGTLLLIIMTLFLGVDQTAAQGINLLYFLPTAALGLLSHRKNGLLDRKLIRSAVPSGMICAAAGAWLATHIDADLLRRPFGVFLLLTGILTLLQKPPDQNAS
ncbi:MAG: sulfite exporter TauE/SafE family protein [Oscillospiraceae bacterium]|nr:sulfite exporter TauE/SafE family protein [Oscillospiraceae bacterium]